MTRGIHLKRLTHSDLQLLGLQGSERGPTADPEHPGGPSARAGSAISDEIQIGGVPPGPVRPENGPHAHPADKSGRHWVNPVLDLAALTREIRLGLEDTLRFLEGGPAQATEGGEITGD